MHRKYGGYSKPIQLEWAMLGSQGVWPNIILGMSLRVIRMRLTFEVEDRVKQITVWRWVGPNTSVKIFNRTQKLFSSISKQEFLLPDCL